MNFVELWQVEPDDRVGIVGHHPAVVTVTDVDLADSTGRLYRLYWRAENGEHGCTTLSASALVDLIAVGDPAREPLLAAGLPHHPARKQRAPWP